MNCYRSLLSSSQESLLVLLSVMNSSMLLLSSLSRAAGTVGTGVNLSVTASCYLDKAKPGEAAVFGRSVDMIILILSCLSSISELE